MATSYLYRWLSENWYKINLITCQSMELSRPSYDLQPDLLASLANSECFYLMVINFTLIPRETPFQHLLYSKGSMGLVEGGAY